MVINADAAGNAVGVFRIQREKENYQLFSDLLGRGEVRKLLSNHSNGEL